MVRITKNISEGTVTITINSTSITITIGEWSKMISLPGVSVDGLIDLKFG